MKRNKLPKGILITGTLLSTILVTTGCHTIEEVVDQYIAEDQMESPIDEPLPETEEEKIKAETPEKEEDTEYAPLDSEAVMCVYGPPEDLYERD